jgi:hypothetical protein
MRGIIGAVVVGLLAGCGGVDGEVNAQADGLKDQQFELGLCEDFPEGGGCPGIGHRALCIDETGTRLECYCTYRGWSCAPL